MNQFRPSIGISLFVLLLCAVTVFAQGQAAQPAPAVQCPTVCCAVQPCQQPAPRVIVKVVPSPADDALKAALAEKIRSEINPPATQVVPVAPAPVVAPESAADIALKEALAAKLRRELETPAPVVPVDIGTRETIENASKLQHDDAVKMENELGDIKLEGAITAVATSATTVFIGIDAFRGHGNNNGNQQPGIVLNVSGGNATMTGSGNGTGGGATMTGSGNSTATATGGKGGSGGTAYGGQGGNGYGGNVSGSGNSSSSSGASSSSSSSASASAAAANNLAASKKCLPKKH